MNLNLSNYILVPFYNETFLFIFFKYRLASSLENTDDLNIQFLVITNENFQHHMIFFLKNRDVCFCVCVCFSFF